MHKDNPAAIHETESSGWPIRVGGVYRNRWRTNCARRVLAISETRVFYGYSINGGPLMDNGDSCSIENFRRTSLPEDQSPVSALVEALKRMIELAESEIPCNCEVPIKCQMCTACDSARIVLSLVTEVQS